VFVQRVQRGWFFFPEHVETVSLDPQRLARHLKGHLVFVFWKQGRWLIGPLLVGGVALFAGRDDGRGRFARETAAIVAASMLFFATTFFMQRYLLYLLPLLAICCVAATTSARVPRWSSVMLVVGLLVLPLFHVESRRFAFDEDLSYRRQVRAQLAATRFVQEQIRGPNATVAAAFPASFGLADPRLGYVAPSPSLQCVPLEEAQWALTCEPGFGPPVEEDTRFELESTFQDGYARVSVYRRKDSQVVE
jgi:hypothetical protein